MSNPVAICTHIKTDGVRCGSPAVSGTDFCHHHSAVKTALAKAPSRRGQRGEFEPIPFVFPEDRASMQINFFLLLQAFNEGRVDLRNYKAMLSMLKSMAANLGKTGSLVEDSDRCSAVGGRKDNDRPTSQKRDVGHPDPDPAINPRLRSETWGTQDQADTAEGPFEFSPELMARMEEIEMMDTNDPSYAERIRDAVAEGLGELKAAGIDLTAGR